MYHAAARHLVTVVGRRTHHRVGRRHHSLHQTPSWSSTPFSTSTIVMESRRTYPPGPGDFPSILKQSPSCVPLIHQQAIVLPCITDRYISSSLIAAYSKAGDICAARKVFDAMPAGRCDVVSWSAIIGAYSQLGEVDNSMKLFNIMRREESSAQPNSVTVLGLLSGIATAQSQQHLVCLHGWVVRVGLVADLPMVNSMINAYSRCGCVRLARRLFDSMARRDLVSWNSMLAGYAREGGVKESVRLFLRMKTETTDMIEPDHQSLGALVTSCTTAAADIVNGKPTGGRGSLPLPLLLLGEQLHAHIIAAGFESEDHLVTTVLGMYMKYGDVPSALKLFYHRSASEYMDAVTWTAVISGLVQNDRADEALSIFRTMLASSAALPLCPLQSPTIATALAACAQLSSSRHGASIHGFLIRRELTMDRAAHNSLVSMYARCGWLEACQLVFDRMPDRDVVSWNTVVSAYAQNGHLEGALTHLNMMRCVAATTDAISVVVVLQCCASLGALRQGRCVHGVAFTCGLTAAGAATVSTALVDMYAKCGLLDSAQACFDAVPERDLVCWTVIIDAYGSHGRGEDALRLYSDFLQTTTQPPNHVMFLSVLAACSHAGLVHQGLELYRSMRRDFGLEPGLEHHACVVDMLGRAGRVEEALAVTKFTASIGTPDVLGILLDSCRTQRNEAVAEEVAGKILALTPRHAGSFVQLAHSYATLRRWDGVGAAWRQMKAMGLRKAPAWSSVELDGTIETFFAHQASHPYYEDPVSLLGILYKEMRTLVDSFDEDNHFCVSSRFD